MCNQYKILLFSSNPEDISFFKKYILEFTSKYHSINSTLSIFGDINKLIRSIWIKQKKYNIYFIDFSNEITSAKLVDLMRHTGIKDSIVYIIDDFNNNVCNFKNNIMFYLHRPIDSSVLSQLLLYDYKNNFLEKQILLNKNSNYFYIKLDEIVYVEVYNRGIKIHMSNADSLVKLSGQADLSKIINLKEKSIIYPDKISNFSKLLDPLTFMQCHQSFIINLDRLVSIRRYCAILNNGTKEGVKVDISKKYWNVLKAKVESNSLAPENSNSLLSNSDLDMIAGGKTDFDIEGLLQHILPTEGD